MEAGYIIDRVRIDLDDRIVPPMWDDESLLHYLDEGVLDFTRNGRPIRDSRTPEVCRISYKVGQNEVPYHESILRIIGVIGENAEGVLRNIPITSQENLVAMVPSYNIGSDYGSPRSSAQHLAENSDSFSVLIDYDENYLRLSTLPVTAGTLHLSVERLPINPITQLDDEIELRREYASTLIAWVCYRAWRKQDTETFDLKSSDMSQAMYQQGVAQAQIEYRRRHTTPGIVRYSE